MTEPATLGADYMITFDGGARGNPGLGYGSYELRTSTGRRRIERLDYGDNVTNNEAEYRTLAAALADLRRTLTAAGKEPRAYRVLVTGDSQLVINQLNGVYKLRHANLRDWHVQIKTLAADFGEVRYVWHPRARSVATLGH
ncbi:MAG: ribonuclease HI family protein [Chloroflexi bacterium]|nr:ribonuclease HI family protein [Chloroflexota bacterium]